METDKKYTDEWGMIHPKPIKLGDFKTYSENPIVFTSELDVLESIGAENALRILKLHINQDGTIAQTPWDRRLASHDNITAFKYLAKKYGFKHKIPLKQLILKYAHPRDILFSLKLFNPFLILTTIPMSDNTPWIGKRLFVKATRTLRDRTSNGMGYTQEYWSKPGQPDILLEYNEEALSGKLLNVLRFSTHKMPLTAYLADIIGRLTRGNGYIFKAAYGYFYRNLEHPVVRRAQLKLDFDYKSL